MAGRPGEGDERDARGYREAAARTWPDHAGRPVPDAAYPVPPDPAIGDVVSAWSNVSTRGLRPFPARRLAMIVVGLLALGGTAVFLLGAATSWGLSLLGHRTTWEAYAAWVPVAAIGVAFLARPRPSCTYLGTAGLAEHVRLPLATRIRTLRFDEVHALTVSQREQRSNGAYQGTHFALRFRDRDGKSVFELAGLRFDHGPWAQDDPYWELARAAIARWQALRWPRLEEEKRATGHARFRVGDATLVVSDGRVQLEGAGVAAGDGLGDVVRAELRDGLLVLRRAGATEGLLRSKGIHHFEAGDVEDLELFLRAAGRWARLDVR